MLGELEFLLAELGELLGGGVDVTEALFLEGEEKAVFLGVAPGEGLL